MAKESKITFCPNCQQPAVRQGNEITCESCDATYTITKKDGAKVKQMGRIEQLEHDVTKLKEIVLPGQEAEAEAEAEAEPADGPERTEPEDENHNASENENEEDW